MDKKTEKKVKKSVKKGYNTAKKTAKKKGKLKQFYIIVAILLLIAIAAGLAYYFVVLKPNMDVNNGAGNGTIVDGNTGEGGNNVDGEFGEVGMTVHFINVGQADCTVIELPDGKIMMIDAGENNKSTETHIKSYLGTLGIKTIDHLMLTHADSDHVGSMDFVLDNFDVKNIYMPKLKSSYKKKDKLGNIIDDRYPEVPEKSNFGAIETKVYYDFYTRAEDETYIENGVTMDCNITYNCGYFTIPGEGYEIEVFCMDESVYNKKFSSAKEKNEISPSVLVKYQGKQLLLTGDSCGSSHDNFTKIYRERYINKNMDFDVYKAAHHGSSTHDSNNIGFIKEIKTEYSILSCKEGKHNGIPSIDVMNNLKANGNKVYRTDECGDIKLELSTSGVIKFTADNNADGVFAESELKEAV